MQGVRLQSGRTQVFFKKMFPIFVCLGELWVECKGCHGNPLFFFSPQIGHMGPTHILEATANSSHARSCLGALSASGVMGDSFSGGQGRQSPIKAISCLSGRVPS